jgi:hypothetical protein
MCAQIETPTKSDEENQKMKQILKWPAVCSLLVLMGTGSTVAQDEGEGPTAFPVEIYVCNFNEGMGHAELNQWADKWNAWIESSTPEPYSAWTLTPFYFGQDQDFDFIWLGTSPNAAALGRAYDNYLTQSGDLQPEFDKFATCGAHSNLATVNIKEPADDGDSSSFVLSFSNCNIAEGKTMDDAFPVLQAWSEYRTGHGSGSGMWVMFPAYGGGKADFDFKFAVSHQNYAALGADYDQYAQGGYAKADELFTGILDCDEARTYNASTRRDGIPDSE